MPTLLTLKRLPISLITAKGVGKVRVRTQIVCSNLKLVTMVAKTEKGLSKGGGGSQCAIRSLSSKLPSIAEICLQFLHFRRAFINTVTHTDLNLNPSQNKQLDPAAMTARSTSTFAVCFTRFTWRSTKQTGTKYRYRC